MGNSEREIKIIKIKFMETIKEVKKIVTEFQKKYATNLENISTTSKKLREACEKIERTWSGSFAGWHGRMYFRDFQTPSIREQFNGEWGGIHGIPEGWEEKQPEEVSSKIEELIGNNFSVEKFESDLENFRGVVEKFRTEIIINLSSFNFNNKEKEKKLLVQIENFTFGKIKGEYISDRLPKKMMSRDSEALRQGICVTSWLYDEGVALEGKSIYKATNNFLVLMDKLIRQLEMKTKDEDNITLTRENHLINLHTDIYNKCHKLYEKGAYTEAAEKSFKVVRDRLRKLTGHETGSEAFGKSKLHIKGAAASNVDEDFNEAVKFLTMAIDRFRNEKSHTSDAKIDNPTRAYEYLRLSSLAMNLLENSEIAS